MTRTIIRRSAVSAEPRDAGSGQERRRARRAAEIDLRFHSQWTRRCFGLGRRVCMCCGERWGRHGCPARTDALNQFLARATPADLRRALREGSLTESEAGIAAASAAEHIPDPFALWEVASS